MMTVTERLRGLFSEDSNHIRLFICISIMSISVFCPLSDGMTDHGDRTAADIIPVESGISIFRYSAFGLGSYPYRSAVPGAPLSVRLDGVPLGDMTPFGPDLDSVSSGVIESISRDGFGRLDIFSVDPADTAETVTTIDFSQGVRRRFTFDSTFRRHFGTSSGILFNGSSSGIHRGEETLKTSLRNYYLKYGRHLGNGGKAFFTARGYRNRDGLVNLDWLQEMGERKTDGMSFSVGMRDIPLGEKTTIDQTVYYRALNSRYGRYGFRKSLDDNGVGGSITMTSVRGRTSYGIRAGYDAVFFDSRIHDDSWTRHNTEIAGIFDIDKDNYRFSIEGGIVNSSHYGAGIRVGGELIKRLPGNDELIIRGYTGTEYPGTGCEYHSSLAFSDTAIVSDVDDYTVSLVEAGLQMNRSIGMLRVTAFKSTSGHPAFSVASNALDVRVTTPFSTRCLMDGEREIYGFTANAVTHYETFFSLDAFVNSKYRQPEDGADIWPYPDRDIGAGLVIEDAVYKEKVGIRTFAEGKLLHWEDVPTTPSGNYLLIDWGISLRVSALELFYRIENITNENIQWFNTLGWLGRNSLWGISWSFRN